MSMLYSSLINLRAKRIILLVCEITFELCTLGLNLDPVINGHLVFGTQGVDQCVHRPSDGR